jgi:hypothetical protein
LLEGIRRITRRGWRRGLGAAGGGCVGGIQQFYPRAYVPDVCRTTRLVSTRGAHAKACMQARMPAGRQDRQGAKDT